jgi:15-cis-phytoene synthase
MNQKQIFKQGSTTFYVSTLFFPRHIKRDVFNLYSFVRVADDYVDQVPADKDSFYHLHRLWDAQETDDTQAGHVVANMQQVAHAHHFKSQWTTAFLDAMQSDLTHKQYSTIEDTLTYIHGSAEVIGLMMARIMRLPPEADEAAIMQGRAMQMINFIRDINEDNELGRCYFPQADLKKFNLPDLSEQTAQNNPEQFKAFIDFQLQRYQTWQTQARAGYRYIPKRLRIPVKTAADMYDWTAKQISADPMIVFRQKVKPSKARIVSSVLLNTLTK